MKFSEHELLSRYPYQRKHNNTLVDVGAHHGFFSRPFAMQGWRVVAFEPEPTNRQGFLRNLQGFDQVICVPKAISDVPSQSIPFYVSDVHPGIHSLKPFHETHSPALEIETVRLDETLSALGIHQVTLLKIDIEGADFLALRSFDFAHIQPEVVICEFMDERSQQHFGYTHHDMVAYMQEHGYTAFVAEWSPIIEYGRPGVACSHTFLRCQRYPLDHSAAWGNLIFVPHTQATQFERTLAAYLSDIKRYQLFTSINKIVLTPAKQAVKRWLPEEETFWYAYARIRKCFLGR